MLKFNNTQFFVLLALGGLAGWALYRRGQQALQAINPLDNENVFYQAANGIAAGATGASEKDQDSVISDLLFKWLQPDLHAMEQRDYGGPTNGQQ